MMDLAAFEIKLNSLQVDTFLVLSQLSRGRSNEEIVKWSGGWNFSLQKVEKALHEIYRVFQLSSCAGEEKKRERAGVLYREYLETRLMSTNAGQMRRNGMTQVTNGVSVNGSKASVIPSEIEGISIDEFVQKLTQLTQKQKRFLSLVVTGKTNEEIAIELGLSRSSPQPMLSNLFSKFGFSSERTTEERKELLRKLIRRALEQNSASVSNASQPNVQHSPLQPEVDVEAVAEKLLHESARMKQLAKYVAEGKKPAEIAQEWDISNHSVSVYLSKLSRRLGLPKEIKREARRQILASVYACYLQGTEKDSTHDEIEIPAREKDCGISGGLDSSRDKQKANGHDHGSAMHYGPGVPVILPDPSTILDVKVVLGGRPDVHIQENRPIGFRPEMLVLYPTPDPSTTHSYLVLVKRT